MTDIEKLRDDVIKAAREIGLHGNGYTHEQIERIVDAVATLDAAMTPDPWALLERAVAAHCLPRGLDDDMNAALAWRQENPDA